MQAIKDMSLKAGDIVVVDDGYMKEDYVISSIGKNYRLWFKGGQGQGAWPSKVKKRNS